MYGGFTVDGGFNSIFSSFVNNDLESASGSASPVQVDYDVQQAQTSGQAQHDGAGYNSLYTSDSLVAAGADDLAYSYSDASRFTVPDPTWQAADFLGGNDLGAGGASAVSEVQVDGVNAYVPGSVPATVSDGNCDPSLSEDCPNGSGSPDEMPAGTQPMTMTESSDSTTGDVTISETDPIQECSTSSSGYDGTSNPSPGSVTSSNCPYMVSAGVTLDRAITQTNNGQTTSVRDSFVATDGQSHSIALEYDTISGLSDGGGLVCISPPPNSTCQDATWELPGSTSFTTYSAGSHPTYASGAPGTIFVEGNTAPDSITEGGGSLTYSSAPDDIWFGGEGNAGGNEITLKYARTVPATGSLSLGLDYITTPAAEPDLTATATDNVNGTTDKGWTWNIHLANMGDADGTFTNGATILTADLPSSSLSYGTVTTSDATGVTNAGDVSCQIASDVLTCTANGGDVTLGALSGGMDVSFAATPSSSGTYTLPASGGSCTVDPNDAVAESTRENDDCSDSVTVKNDQSISFTSTPPSHPVVGGTYDVMATGGNSGNNVRFSIAPSSTTGACSISGATATEATVSFTGVGTCIVDADQDGNASYLPAPTKHQTLVIAPGVSSVSPSSGSAAGGTPITITGTGFQSGDTVKIGQGDGAHSGAASAGSVDVVSSTEITAVTGSGRAGTWNVFVTDLSGPASPPNNGDEFTYTRPAVSGVGPSGGPIQGGTPITITGTGFETGDTVLIAQGNGTRAGAVSATDVNVVSATQITATTPAGRAGTWNLFVIDPAGAASPIASGARFTYARLSVSSVQPNSGSAAGSSPITITGAGFQAGDVVKIGQGAGPGAGASVATGVTVVSPTQITATTAPGRAGTWNLFVIDPSGATSQANSSDQYTYTKATAQSVPQLRQSRAKRPARRRR